MTNMIVVSTTYIMCILFSPCSAVVGMVVSWLSYRILGNRDDKLGQLLSYLQSCQQLVECEWFWRYFLKLVSWQVSMKSFASACNIIAFFLVLFLFWKHEALFLWSCYFQVSFKENIEYHTTMQVFFTAQQYQMECPQVFL